MSTVSVRQRPAPAKSGDDDEVVQELARKQQLAPPSAISQAMTGTAYLANRLPTGTLLAFQLLSPFFTNNGDCDGATRAMTVGLLLVLALSCFLACLTDSVKAADGRVYYGMATAKGLWFFDVPPETPETKDTAKYRLVLLDFVHAVLSVLVFAAVAMRDGNVVNCLFAAPGKELKEVLNALPLGVGVICSFLFVVFPVRRHGLGYSDAGK